MRAALDAGRPVSLERIDTIADGLAPIRTGELTFQHMRELADDVVTVSDLAIKDAARFLLQSQKLVVEYSGAAAVAAIRGGRVATRGRRIAAVLSGGNLDPSLMAELAG
jgi:threonine dehydratase